MLRLGTPIDVVLHHDTHTGAIERALAQLLACERVEVLAYDGERRLPLSAQILRETVQPQHRLALLS